MQTQFYIYKKEAHPNGPVAIISNDPNYPKANKMAFYAYLGHSVINVEDMKRYVISCFISDRTGRIVRIANYTTEQLDAAFKKACEWYGNVLPVPDNGRYQDYV
jgi:hypothetical protein